MRKINHPPEHIEFIRARNRSEKQRKFVRAYWTPEKRAQMSERMKKLWGRIKETP